MDQPQSSPHTALMMSRSLGIDVPNAAGDRRYEPEPEPEFTVPGPSPTGLNVPVSPGTQQAIADSTFEPMISPSKEHLGLSLDKAKRAGKLSYRSVRAQSAAACDGVPIHSGAFFAWSSLTDRSSSQHAAGGRYPRQEGPDLAGRWQARARPSLRSAPGEQVSPDATCRCLIDAQFLTGCL